MSNSIRYDLYRNLNEKLNQLLQDTADLYEVAGLETSEATADIFHILIFTLTNATVKLGLPIDVLLDAVVRSAKHIQQRKRAP